MSHHTKHLDNRLSAVIALLFGVVVLLGGCNDPVSGDPPSDSPDGAAPVAQVTGTAPGRTDGTVEMRVPDSVSTQVTVATAAIGADGSFTLELSSAVPPATALYPLSNWQGVDLTGYSTLSISDTDGPVSTWQSSVVVLDESGSDVGEILLFDGPSITGPGPGIQVRWVYANRALDIVGDATLDIPYTFDLILQEGWNQVVIYIINSGERAVMETGSVPAGVDWFGP
jgi:hypothetical protein